MVRRSALLSSKIAHDGQGYHYQVRSAVSQYIIDQDIQLLGFVSLSRVLKH